jgi:hypothetical protein
MKVMQNISLRGLFGCQWNYGWLEKVSLGSLSGGFFIDSTRILHFTLKRTGSTAANA